MTDSLNLSIQESVRKNWTHSALSDFNGQTLKFSDVAERIVILHNLFREIGIKPGDRIALCAKNSSNWATSFLAIIGYGAVAVPLLHDFHADTIRHLIGHCEARLLFSDKNTVVAIDAESLKGLEGVISTDDFSALMSKKKMRLGDAEKDADKSFDKKYSSGFSPEDFTLAEDNPGELCVINYTSGSTGFSKGVMLNRISLMSNLKFAVENINYLYPDDGIVSMLPLAHMFGLSIEFLFPFLKGCHITFLGKVPAPTVILKAFAKVRPKLVIAVPLILEKIVKTKVMPSLKKPLIKVLLAIPGLRNTVYSRVRKRLIEAFGGNLIQMIVGGAALNHEVEKLMMRIKFPLTVGYGMTECGPLIAYAPWDRRPLGSCGRIVDRMEMRIDSPDPENKAGELWVRGSNIMDGYYKAKDMTESVFRDGWMNTGDLCQVDKEGYIYIRGRNKSMILGPSGQNIYPEEIEARLNSFQLVAESVIVERDGRLVALIYPDPEEIKKNGYSVKTVNEILSKDLKTLNSSLASYEKVASFEVMDSEFEKTPKRSIKRFLYS